MNQHEFQVILGSLLGDGSLRRKTPGSNTLFQEGHSIRQRDYLEWKAWALSRFSPRIHILTSSRGHPAIHLSTCVSEELNLFQESFYPLGKKQVSPDLTIKLDDLGLAVWYQDDGSYNRRTGSSQLATCGFSPLENRWMAESLFPQLFDLHPRVGFIKREYPLLRFSRADTLLLIKRVSPFIHPDLAYKIGGY